MNKAILIKLYNEATESTTDLMDMGRKELAQELIRECSSFIQDHYPTPEDKTLNLIDDLEQVIWGLDEKDSHGRMLKMHLGYSRCFDWLVKEVAKAYSLASENKLKNERRESIGDSPSQDEISDILCDAHDVRTALRFASGNLLNEPKDGDDTDTTIGDCLDNIIETLERISRKN